MSFNLPDDFYLRRGVSLEQAETIAFQAVAFLAADADSLEGLLRLTGHGLESLKTALTDPARLHETLAGILSVLLENEARLLTFCEANALNPGAPGAALRRLAPASPEWPPTEF